eukprot:scaffold9732_cov124-Skeletonema_marinoi.AAC.1
MIVATAMAGWLLATGYNKKLRATFQIFRQKNYASMGLDSTHSTRGISTINITTDQPFEMEPKTPVSMFLIKDTAATRGVATLGVAWSKC